MIFHGQYYHSLDDKGRVVVPSLFRDSVFPKEEERRFVVTVTSSEDKNLYMISHKLWEKKVEKINQDPNLGDRLQDIYRFFFGMAYITNLDRQHRISLPDYLKVQAELEKDILFVGVYQHIEIWSPPQWKKWQQFSNTRHQQSSEITKILYQG